MTENVEIKTVGVDKFYIPKINQLIENYKASEAQVSKELKKINAVLEALTKDKIQSVLIKEAVDQYTKQKVEINKFIEESHMRISAAEELKKGLESGNPETINLIANFCQAFGL